MRPLVCSEGRLRVSWGTIAGLSDIARRDSAACGSCRIFHEVGFENL